MSKIKKLKEQCGQIQTDMHALIETVESRGENDDFTPEERTKYTELRTSYDSINSRIKMLEEDEVRAAELATSHAPASGNENEEPEKRAQKHQEELRSAFLDMVCGKPVKTELRSELTGSGENQIVVPKLIADKVEKAMRDTGDFLGNIDLIFTASGAPLTQPTVDGTGHKIKKLTENTKNEDTAKIQFNGITLHAYDYVTPIFPISLSLIEDAGVDVEAVIVEIITDCLKEGLKDLATVTGTGTDDVNALLNKAPIAITSAAVDAISYADLVKTQSSVNIAYAKNGTWMMNSNTRAACLLIQNPAGQYIYTQSMQEGFPDRLLGRPVVINDYMPDIAAGKKAIAFGDLKKYRLRVVKNFRIVVFKEKFADSLQVGVMGHVRADGDLIDAGSNPIKVLAMKTA